MVERLASSMKEFGVCVDILCMDNLQLVKLSDIEYKWSTRLLLSFFRRCKNNLLLRVVRKLMASHMMKDMMKRYNLVDFHYFALYYLPFMAFCRRKDIPYDITLWGSDLMRADAASLAKKKDAFDECRYIKCAENLHQELVRKYSHVYDAKMRVVYWGNSDYDAIDNLPSAKVEELRNSLLNNQEKIIVTCGYNGAEGQNHAAIIDAIKGLPEVIKTKSSFLFPMTYGATTEYLSKVRNALDKVDVHYTIIDKYISSEEIAAIRLASDVVVNIQKTDAFSGSLQGHLYCNNVMIIGEWLNYVPLDNNNVYYIKTSIAELSSKILAVLSELPKYKEKCMGNHDKMNNLTSWKAVMPRWASCYC